MSGPSLDEVLLDALDDDGEICSCILVGTGMCAIPATHYATAGCVHEHLGTRPLCDYHADLARDRDPSIKCGYCRRAGHSCELRIAEIKPIGDQR